MFGNKSNKEQKQQMKMFVEDDIEYEEKKSDEEAIKDTLAIL
jgi:hypothetical protein